VIPAEIANYFSYDPITGLVWKHTKIWRSDKIGLPKKVDSHGYLILRFQKKDYKAHRVAWYLQTGDQPPTMVDHRNQQRLDNRWENLRAADASVNGTNAKVRADNNSGATGVYFVVAKNRWLAAINLRGRKFHIGTFLNKADAVAARSAAKNSFRPT
jgi:hypothetical protein